MSLHLECRGGGPPLLLIHGFGATSHTWWGIGDALARDHRLLMVDLRGHGRSPAPRDSRYSPVDHAEAVRERVQGEDPGPLTVLGHSLGGAVALLLALESLRGGGLPVERLILVSPAAYRQRLPPYIALARLPVLPLLFYRLVPGRWISRTALRRIFHDPEKVPEASVEAYGAMLETPGGRYATVESARRIFPQNLEGLVSRYPEVDLPTLLLWGREDPVVPLALGRRLAGDLPDARLDVLEACGHVPQEERPEETLARFRDFLGG